MYYRIPFWRGIAQRTPVLNVSHVQIFKRDIEVIGGDAGRTGTDLVILIRLVCLHSHAPPVKPWILG